MKKIKLSSQQKSDLLKTARLKIQEALFGNVSDSFPSLNSDVFSESYGVFVTLTIDGRLRGCIGYVEGVKAIREAVPEMALQAAFHDPRFSPLRSEEFSQIQIEISILYPLEEVFSIDEIKVGRDGLVMERGFSRGLLLPQVAVEWKWDREEFLNQTCRKAGMESECWKNGAKIFKFEAEIFSERDETIK